VLDPEDQVLRFSETSETLSMQRVTSQKTYIEEILALQITRTFSSFYITFIPREELSFLTANAFKINQCVKTSFRKTDIHCMNFETTALYYCLSSSDVTQRLPMFRRTLLRLSSEQRTPLLGRWRQQIAAKRWYYHEVQIKTAGSSEIRLHPPTTLYGFKSLKT